MLLKLNHQPAKVKSRFGTMNGVLRQAQDELATKDARSFKSRKTKK